MKGALPQRRSAFLIEENSGNIAPAISGRLKNMENLSCVLCGNSSSDKLLEFEAQSVLRCRSCGLCFWTDIPDEEEIKRRYGADYFEGEYSESVNPSESREVGAKIFVSLERYVKGGRLLDVGCGAGEYLAAAKARGWEPHGVDISAFAVRVAQQRPGVSARAGFLETVGFEDGFFDAAIMIHSIEHQVDPLKTLKELKRTLKPGGYALIATPNINSAEFKRLGKDWVGLQIGHHFYFFNKTTLRRICEAAGFEVLECEAPADIVSGAGVAKLVGDKTGVALRKIARKRLGWAIDLARKKASAVSEGESVILIARKPA